MEWWLIPLGLLAGILSGLLGIGGGILMTPVGYYLLRLSWQDAVMVSLVAIVLQVPIGIYRHHRKDSIQWPAVPLLFFGGLVGVFLGALALRVLPVLGLKIGFALLLVASAIRMVQKPSEPRDLPQVAAVTMGAGAGFISRLLGVGGGILIVPAMTLTGTPAKVAVGTALVLVWTNALAGVAFGGVAWWHLATAIPLALGAMLGSPVGVHIAHTLPEQGLRRVVAAGMVLAAASMLAFGL